jgi:tetratricopeptide (TPR) repeat protein
MPANVDGMVREGISAYRAGRKDEARALLLRAVEIDQYNEQAWLWLSAVVESVDEQRTCLENVLTINPNNDRAKQGLNMLTQKSAAPAATTKSAATQADDVLAGSSFTSTPIPSANAFGVDDDADELPSSIEWNAPPPVAPPVAPPTASSSASSTHHVDEPSAAEYDDWVNNLNLGSNNADDVFQAGPMQDAAAQFMSTAFDDNDDDNDVFNPGASAALFDSDDDDLFSSESGPFSSIDTAPPINDTPPPVAKSPKAAFTSQPNKSVLTPQKSPGSLLDEIDDDPISSAFDDEYDQDELDKLDASEFFQYIPKDIHATRLPGTRERYPALVILGLLGVIVLNLGAVAWLVMNLTAK